jgi:hypothetical protein
MRHRRRGCPLALMLLWPMVLVLVLVRVLVPGSQWRG